MGYAKKSVLLVEDSTLTRFSLKRLLENNGYAAEEAISGEEALAKVNERLDPFDLIIIDIYLPGIDGLTTIEKIKKDTNYRYVPIMVFTADTKVSTVRQAIEKGAVEYLCKPFTAEQLLQRVDRLIGHSEKDPREILERISRLEINRARRGNARFTLVMAQRKAASKLSVAEVARHLQKRLREVDEVVILDDNLLALVLPVTDAEGAAIVIKKFQEWVGERDWYFGLAKYPEDGADEKALIKRAEEQLHEESKEIPPTGGIIPGEEAPPDEIPVQ